MKKYLLGFSAVVLAVAFTAFTTPKKSFTNFYRFTYQLSTFGQTDVETETVAKWGLGTLVTSTSDFSAGCSGVLNKACQIIVPEASVIDNGSGQKRLLSDAAGDTPSADNVVITATANGSNYYVSGGTNVSAQKNKN